MSGIFIHFMRICRASFETIGSKLRRLSNKMYKIKCINILDFD